MENRSVTHPPADDLRAFGLGKLDDAAAQAVLSHLESCPDCRKEVASVSGDSFLNRLRDAHTPSSTPAPNKPLAGVAATLKTVGPAATTPPAIPDLPPELANSPQCEVLRKLGGGGMGVVYLARNKLMGRLEVLKVMNKELIDRSGAKERFLREIQLAASLSDPHVVAAYSALQIGDLLIFAMEYVEGEDLDALVKRNGVLPVANACYYVQQAAQGLQRAFAKGMVHRDIKPQNLILFKDGKKHVVKILDFGLGKATSEKAPDLGLTGDGKMLGTPHYIAPEQIQDAARADIRADVYSLGCTLYYLLTGEPPFCGANLYAILHAQQSVEAKPLNQVRPEVPADLAGVVTTMMAKQAAKRYQTPAEVVQALMPFIKPGAKGAAARPSAALPQGTTPETAAAKDTKVGPSNTQAATSEPTAAEGERLARWDTLTESMMHDIEPRRSAGGRKRRSAALKPAAMKKGLLVVGAAGVLLLGLVALWAAGVFTLKTPEGTIVLEIDQPDAEVLVDGRKITVNVPGDNRPIEIEVPPGQHQLRISKDGFVAVTKEIELKTGKSNPIKVRLEPVPTIAVDDKGFVPLFNGKDMAGWETLPDEPNTWRVDGGLLIGSGAERCRLFTKRDDYGDFHLRVEVRMNDGLSGLGFRSGFERVWPAEKPVWPVCYAVGLNSTHPTNPHRTGSLYIGRETSVGREFVPVRTVRENPAPPHTWTLLEVIARGNRFIVKVKGETTADYTDSENLFSRGRIALIHYDPAAVREFRKVEIKELPPEKPAPEPGR